VQEAALSARTILCCGTRSIDIHHSIIAATWLNNGPSSFGKEISGEMWSFLSILSHTSRSRPIDLSLTWILRSAVGLRCSEPRDRVFGLLGLLTLSTRKSPHLVNLAPDYTKSVVDLYCEVTRACVGENRFQGSFDSLGYERETVHTVENLPTWVSSWYCESVTRGAMRLPDRVNLWTYGQLDVDPPLVPGSSVGRVLSIRGVVLATISKHTEALTQYHGRAVSNFVSEALKLFPKDIKPSRAYRRLAYTLNAGYHNEKAVRLATGSAKPSRMNNTARDGSDSSILKVQDTLPKATQSFEMVARYCYARKAFLTQSGLLGIGPKTLQDGDVIAVSKLSQSPMVLRPAEDCGAEHYSMIGPTLVEGITSAKKIFAAAVEGEGIGTIHLV
jgi:hypothetical protein